MRKKVKSNSYVLRILNIFQQEGSSLNVEKILPLGPDEWLDGINALESNVASNLDLSNAGFFTEGTFYSAYFNDLKKAKESIIIFSPFLTSRGVNRWIDILRLKIGQKVQIRIVTRPVGNQGGILEDGLEELISNIRKIGIVVDLRKKMHEKFAIMDNELLWHGSLNILSHRDTSESMIRIPSTIACQQIGRFVTTSKNINEENSNREIDISEKENPVCSNCNTPMVWKNERYGVYFQCEKCKEKVNTRRNKLKTNKRKGKNVKTDHKCPKCGGYLLIKNGKYGEFLGCSKFPDCPHKENIKYLNQMRLSLE